MNLLKLRPDAVAVNRALRKVAILERCQPYDSVVGARGVLDATGIQQATTFLELLASKRKEILRKSAAASVEALLYI